MKARSTTLRRASERSGRQVELLAALMLMLKGYRILGRRVRTRLGEIDLIARSRSGILCFVEVKLRQTDSAALDSVRMAQQGRIARAAQLFLSQHPALGAKGVRFDVVTVGARRLPRHFPGAWHPEDWRPPFG
ncbi:MAG: YraN family protein [Alphaproteobacteria bacterium]|nr:YraN family protein [Alphaproteobacteria bacterium]